MFSQSIATAAARQRNAFTRPWAQTTAIAVYRRFVLAWQIRSERRKLAGLSDRALHDIGITRNDAKLESNRGLFDLPVNRR